MLYVGIGILGATVMPHKLYLRSSILQTRPIEPPPAGRPDAIKFATIDLTVALMLALFINGAILWRFCGIEISRPVGTRSCSVATRR
jgi:manganese transport protein